MDCVNVPEDFKNFCSLISLEKLLHMCNSYQSDIMKQIEENPAIFGELSDFLEDRTSRSFVCLSNFFTTISPEGLFKQFFF